MAWYRTGTVAVTNGSATVTGTSTQWVSAAKTGDAIHLPDGRIYEILTINSNTSITLATNYLGTTASGQGYAIQPTRGVVQNVYDLLVSYMSSLSAQQDGPLSGRFGDGTVSAPGITFLSDQDTGLYRPSANQLAAATSGVMRWLLTTTGFTLNLPMNGTAVTQSSVDTTAGRLLKVGDFGVGGIPPLIGNAGVTDNTIAVGLYCYDSTNGSTGGPTGTTFGFIWHMRRTAGGGEQQIAFIEAGSLGYASAALHYRSRGGGAWGPWKKIYDTSNVVGTVSQSGGTPSGAIIERGSNANGEYVRFADGTQICTASLTVNASITTAHLGGFRNTGQTWTFPAVFAAAPRVTGAPNNINSFAVFTTSVTSTTACSVFHSSVASQATAADLIASVTAIGRWF